MGWPRCAAAAGCTRNARCARARANCARRSASPSRTAPWRWTSRPIALYARIGKVDVVTGIRIGLTKAVDLPWRYGLKDSKFVSKPFPK